MALASRQTRTQRVMDINYVLSLDDEPVFSEAPAGLRRPVLPSNNIQKCKKVGSTQQTLNITHLREENNDTNGDEVHPFFASPPVLPPPIPTGQPTWIAATSDPVYRAAQLAQERKAEANTLQVHTADNGTQLEPIRSHLNSERSATLAGSAKLRPMNGPHGVNVNGKPFGLPDDFCEEGFEPYPEENTIPQPQQPQQPQSGQPSHLSRTPRHPPHLLPPIESLESGPAVNQPADDKGRQSQQATGSRRAPSVTKRAKVASNPASTTAPSERQIQLPPTQDNNNSRRIGNQSLRSLRDSNLRTSNSSSSNHSIHPSRQAQATLAAPRGLPPGLDRRPAQHSHAAEETEDVDTASTDGRSDDDLYEMTDGGWETVHSGPYPDTPQRPKLGSSGSPQRAGHNSPPSNLRPLAPRPPQPVLPTPRPSRAHPSNLTIHPDPPRPSTTTQHSAPAPTLPLPPQFSPPHPPAPHIPTPPNPPTNHLPTYARSDSKAAVQARKYIALDITDAPCTRCVARGQACYRSERGTFWKCAYCQTLRGGRREECVLHER